MLLFDINRHVGEDELAGAQMRVLLANMISPETKPLLVSPPHITHQAATKIDLIYLLAHDDRASGCFWRAWRSAWQAFCQHHAYVFSCVRQSDIICIYKREAQT